MRNWTMFSAIGLAMLALSCDGASGDGRAALVKRGSAVYDANCIACHAREPHKPGAVGPAVAASSLELLEAKVLRNEYPAGYTPQRDTKAMIPLAHLEPDIAALHAFLEKSAP